MGNAVVINRIGCGGRTVDLKWVICNEEKGWGFESVTQKWHTLQVNNNCRYICLEIGIW